MTLHQSLIAVEERAIAAHNQRWGAGRTATPRQIAQERATRSLTTFTHWLSREASTVIEQHRRVGTRRCTCAWEGSDHAAHVATELCHAANREPR